MPLNKSQVKQDVKKIYSNIVKEKYFADLNSKDHMPASQCVQFLSSVVITMTNEEAQQVVAEWKHERIAGL